MATKKIKETLFKSWDDVGKALEVISEVDQKIAAAEIVLNNRINAIKGEFEDSTRDLIKQKKELETAIQEFTEANIGEFVDSKTKPMTFGEVGFRKTTSIITRNVKAIIEALKQHKMFDCIDTTEKINKDELSKYDDAAILKIGAKRKVKDAYFYKIYSERIEQ